MKLSTYSQLEETVHQLADVRIMIVQLEAVESFLKGRVPGQVDVEMEELILGIADRVIVKARALQYGLRKQQEGRAKVAGVGGGQ